MVSTYDPTQPVHIFYSYAPGDELLRDKLEKHLAGMKNKGLITSWSQRNIKPGKERQKEIDENIQKAHVILILVSHNFISSDYCYGVEMQTVLRRHQAGEAWLIPIILRPVVWEDSELGTLQSLPFEGQAIRL